MHKSDVFTFGLLASSLVKKYECRTGTLERFFTSSVEFCKFKFDKDNRDNNRTGTQAPPGPRGATGPAGTAGQQVQRGVTEQQVNKVYLNLMY